MDNKPAKIAEFITRALKFCLAFRPFAFFGPFVPIVVQNLYHPYILCTIIALLLVGCRDDRAASTVDSWYNPPPLKTYPLTGWKVLDFKRLHQVAADQQATAEKMLETTAALEITPQQAADLIGQPLPAVPGVKPYLTRGVYLNRGGFSVYWRNDQLLISHASMGHNPVPMKRQALVLQLAQPPAEVFVTCSMAE